MYKDHLHFYTYSGSEVLKRTTEVKSGPAIGSVKLSSTGVRDPPKM